MLGPGGRGCRPARTLVGQVAGVRCMTTSSMPQRVGWLAAYGLDASGHPDQWLVTYSAPRLPAEAGIIGIWATMMSSIFTMAACRSASLVALEYAFNAAVASGLLK